MGTNFYWIAEAQYVSGPLAGEPVDLDRDDPKIHIGKRSAAGLYCWDCGVTLAKGGEAIIHTGDAAWYESCPRCGAEPTKTNNLATGPAAVELGFAEPAKARPTGVHGCASFTWAQDPAAVRATCSGVREPIVVDEYGRKLTGFEFLRMLTTNCPIEFTELIGEAFS